MHEEKSMAGGTEELEGKYSGKFALSKILICGECGSEYRRQTSRKSGKEKAVWRCENRLRNGIRYCRHSPTLEEESLHRIILKAINRMADQIQIGKSEAKEPIAIRTDKIAKQTREKIQTCLPLNRFIAILFAIWKPMKKWRYMS